MVNLICGHSEPYLETWPASGSMRNGQASERPMSAPPTNGSESSSSPGPALLPTPTTSEARGPGAPDGNRNDTLRARIANLPTPRARDSKGLGFEDGLPNVIRLLKTPTAQLAVNGGSQHPDKRKAGGHGPTLADEVEFLMPDGAGARLLPTPTVADSRGTRNRRIDGTSYSSGYGLTLTDATTLLPTPTATPYGSNQSNSPGAAVRPSLDSLAPKLLPTPRASDGAKGGPNQRGSKGDLTLPSAAHRIGESTARPSDDGNSSSDDPPLGQLTIEVA
ncbi:hypothetical protein ACFW1M_11645 [Streptomyces inhibens]|uniref:hypothetical protein n=1 Tax=Streptomyces inhibens TaxID=2293571 RepID=UPI0036A4006C